MLKIKEERNNPPSFLFMFKFGNIEVKGKVVLAPMAGYTFNSYREFMNKFGVSLCYTEMVSIMGLIYDNEETLEYIRFPKSEVPTGVQLFGDDPEKFIEAIKICEKENPNIDFYDVNMGCPVNKVTKTGAGSALLKDPVKCGEIIRAIKSVTDKPVSAKIRLGWDNKSINFLKVIEELEKAGIDLIAIHARTTKDLYIGTPKYELIKDLREKMNVPLVVSGNIYTVDDAINALNITKADAVMVARGAVGNPRLITNINKIINNKEIKNPSLMEQIEYCKELAMAICKEKGEIVGMRVFRSIGSKFFNGFPNCKMLKNRITTETHTYSDLEIIIEEYLLEYID